MANGFKTALFGFKRKDVIRHLEGLYIENQENMHASESCKLEMRAEIDGLAAAKEELISKNSELKQKTEELASQVDAMDNSISALRREKEAIAFDFDELSAANTELTEKLELLEARYESEVKELKAQLAEKDSVIIAREKKIMQMTDELALSRSTVSAKCEQIDQLERRIEEFKSGGINKTEYGASDNTNTILSVREKGKKAVAAVLSYVRKR